MEYLQEKFAPVIQMLDGASTGKIVLVAIIIAVFWFIPTIISLFRNPKNVGKIFLLNIPLGLTFTPWLILLAWSVNPNVSFEKIRDKIKGRKKSQEA